MEAADEDLARSDVDAEMTALTPEDMAGPNPEAGDEVENLRNSLREVVHDESIRPKMQCLMMDSSFSMVTVQGEDSGIAWETTPSRCNTPWASEAAGNPAADPGHPAAASGSHPAGKIIFVMDEELISRRKKPKERAKSRQGQREAPAGSAEDVSGRPELVEVSQPNVKPEDADQEELSDNPRDKEQQLFRLVSEGSEILNIVVPPKLATVDEEESRDMVDNLSYLEESPVAKVGLGSHDSETLTAAEEQENPPVPAASGSMDPPGAPVARPPVRKAAGNVDYFEAFSMVDAQAPGGPAVVSEVPSEPEAEAAAENQVAQRPEQARDAPAGVDAERSDTTGLVEITSELLDEVFYGSADNYLSKSLDSGDGGAAKGLPLRLPSKPSGSTLFGSQEDILTPIFLPEGPPKIIDPILLEEPKAMAFLYTDLYEEALGSRKKEEDAESLASEKSFHSRHSDREARGYLEKYVLIDETPIVEVDPKEKDEQPAEGPRVLTQDLYEFGDFATDPGQSEMPNSEEEITDFFRSSGNSSPCDIEPFPRSLEEDEAQKPAKIQKNVSIKVAETPADPLSASTFELVPEEPDWEITDDHPMAVDDKDVSGPDDAKTPKRDSESSRPVAPPRRRAASALKECLDLTPLTPVDGVAQEQEEAGAKEQRVEEKETASPAETADEGDGDGEEPMPTPAAAIAAAVEDELTESPETDAVRGADEVTETEEGKSETAGGQTEAQETDVQPAEPEKTEKQGESSEEPKNKGQCVIL